MLTNIITVIVIYQTKYYRFEYDAEEEVG
jgi:hypothetical protein